MSALQAQGEKAMTIRHYILATAGHVDHGKSALVKALTGTDPDRLPEEKARGITIDLGFAHLDLPAPVGPQPQLSGLTPQLSLRIGVVDVPGHEDFVKNMVAGVGSIDLALLIVAADDGWMPQSEEHLQILSYLGVSRAVVALTKIDLAEGKEAQVVAAVQEKLRHSPFAQAPIVPTSVVTGQGIAELAETLARMLAATPPPRDLGKPRLPVDRVFTLRGIGTVVTGTLSGGTLRRGQAVVIQPGAKASRIRSLQCYNQDVEASGPGTRTALNLPDVEPRSAGNAIGVGRGDVITLPELGAAGDTLEVVLEKSARLLGSQTAGARPIKDKTLVRVHHGSGNTPARVLLLDGGELLPGQRALAQLRLEQPLFGFAGDRFIVRDWAEQATLAGGLILEPESTRRHWRSEPRRELLQLRAQAPGDPQAFVASQLARDGAAQRAQLLLKSRFSAAEAAQAVDELVAAKRAIVTGELVADAAWWQALGLRAAQLIEQAHQEHPEWVGLPLNQLRGALEDYLVVSGTFEGLVAELCRGGFTQAGVAIRRLTHRPALPPHLQTAGARLRAALTAKPLEPPSRSELAPDALSQQALRFLLQTGEAVEVSPEVVLSAESYERAVSVIKEQLGQRGSATVSDLRQALGSSRRVMVPLLERLDRQGVTRRQGDLRVLGKSG
jgi:selenocysteine-specific elongation factor